MGFRLAFLVSVLMGDMLLAGPGPAWGQGQKIVSLNLCADQLLLSLADPADIAALSPLAAQCAESVFCDKAKAFKNFRPDSEALWTLPPSLVLTGPYSHPLTSALAQRLRIPLYRVGEVQRLEEIPQQFRQTGQWLDALYQEKESAQKDRYSERAAQLSAVFSARMDKILGGVVTIRDEDRPSVMVLNEESPPLIMNMLTRLGFRVIKPPRAVLLEYLLAHPPSLLVISRLGEGVSLKEQYGLPALLDGPLATIPVISLPARLTLCGTMQTLEALDMLQQAYNHLAHKSRPPRP